MTTTPQIPAKAGDIDIDKLKALALAFESAETSEAQLAALAEFNAAANPAAVLALCNENADLRAEVERLTTENANLQHAFNMVKGAAPAAGTDRDADPTEASVKIVREAIADYYRALNARQHGHLAMDRAFRAIERELGMSWDMWTRAENEAIAAHSKAGEPVQPKKETHD
jgi:hypothetical protein